MEGSLGAMQKSKRRLHRYQKACCGMRGAKTRMTARWIRSTTATTRKATRRMTVSKSRSAACGMPRRMTMRMRMRLGYKQVTAMKIHATLVKGCGTEEAVRERVWTASLGTFSRYVCGEGTPVWYCTPVSKAS